MRIRSILRQIVNDIYCHPRRFFLYLLVPYSFIWTVLEPVIYFIPQIKLAGFYKFALILILSFIIAFFKMKRSSHIKIKVPYSNSVIEILYGDLFLEPECKVIPVNEFFDSKVGNHVAENSVHGTFIKKILGGHEKLFDDLVNYELKGTLYKQVERPSGNIRRYPIGTTVSIETHGSIFFLLALSRTDINTLKAKADVSDLMAALLGLWNKARTSCNGRTVSLPLIGGGLSNVDLTPNVLLRLIIISIIAETKKSKITDNLRIILQKKYSDEIDLDTIKEEFG